MNKLQLAKEYLRGNPSASNAEAVKALDVSPRTVTEARRQLIAEGKAVPRDHARRPAPLLDFLDSGASPEAEPETDRDLDVVIANIEKDLGPALSVEDLIRRLSSIIRVAGTSQLGVSAILALSRIRESLGARDKLGPGPPLTAEERLRRGTLVVEALTPEQALQAVQTAHPQYIWTKEEPDAPDPVPTGS